MYYQIAVIQSLKNNSRGLSYTDLRHDVDEVLSMYDMKISKNGLTATLKTLIDSEVLTKKQILKKETGRPMIYTITKGSYAQKQVELIIEVGKATKLIDYFRDILNTSEGAFEGIKKSKGSNKKNLYTELNENLILICEVVSPMIAKMILYQTTSIENPYLIKEIRRIEKLSRNLFGQASVLSKKLGKNNHEKFIDTFDHGFTKEISTKYQKFLRKNTLFKKD